MAKRVIWTPTASAELENIIEYWNERTKSKTYSSRISKNIKAISRLLSKHPEIGRKSSFPNVRVRPFMKHFQIIYSVREEDLVILSFWDNRQNPENKLFE